MPATSKALAEQEATAKIYGLLLEGHSRPDIEEACREMFPKLDRKKLIAGAVTAFSNITEENPKILKGWCLEVTRDLYRKMVEVGDYAGALRAVSEANKIGQQIIDHADDF